MTIVKVCGMTRPEDIEAANRLRPDIVGFVFHRPSRRCVTREGAMELGSMLDPSIRRVGVFVDEDPLVISELVGCGTIDTVQLHGVEDGAYIRGLERLIDMVLLDAGMGSGRTFDWSLLEGMERDYILSGGLDSGNISEAVGRYRPFGVDVSSGVETDGRKDPAKMAAFIEAVRCT